MFLYTHTQKHNFYAFFTYYYKGKIYTFNYI